MFAFVLGIFILDIGQLWCCISIGFIYGLFAMNVIPIVLNKMLDICEPSMIPTINTMLNICAQFITGTAVLYFGAIMDSETKMGTYVV
jgi:hypothetical protein